MVILKENVNLRPYWDGKSNYNRFDRFANSTNITTSASLVLWMNQRGYDLINVDDAIKELSKMRNIGKLVLGSFRNLVKTLVEEEIITDDAEQAIQNPYGIEWERRTFEVAKELFFRNVSGMNAEIVALEAINNANTFITNYKNSLNQCFKQNKSQEDA